ncbi:MAG: hypothetical protein GTO41_00685 [Burkholderiales bacterium]|nr:hypothetical protein [Burkholderiales bacterium]
MIAPGGAAVLETPGLVNVEGNLGIDKRQGLEEEEAEKGTRWTAADDRDAGAVRQLKIVGGGGPAGGMTFSAMR